MRRRKEKEKESNKLSLMILSIITLLIIIFFFIYRDAVLKDINEITDKYDKSNDEEQLVDEEFLAGLRLASIGRFDESIGYFEKAKYKDLSKSDQEIYLYALLQVGEYQKIIDLEKKYDEKIIDKLIEEGNVEPLTELETDSTLIHFELAVLENDLKKVTELRKDKEMIVDERRANIIANALYVLDEKEEAVNFTSLMAHDGINMWNNDSKVSDVVVIPTEEESSSNLTFVILIGVLILIVIGVVIIYKKTNLVNWLQELKEKGNEEIDVAKVGHLMTSKKDDNEKVEVKGDAEGDSIEKTEEDDKYSYEYNEDDLID